MESNPQKDDDITAQTILSKLFFRPNEKGGEYLGFLNEKIKKNIFLKIQRFLISKNVINEEKLIFIKKLHQIFTDNPDIMSILTNINVVKDVKDSLYYQFVNLYLKLIFSDTKIDDTITQLKTALLDILNLLIHYVDCSYSIYEYLYSYISSYYIKEDRQLRNDNFKDYLQLVEVLYGSRHWTQSSSSFPKSFIYCQGNNYLMLEQYSKKATTAPTGVKIYAWFFIKKNREYLEQVNLEADKKRIETKKETKYSMKNDSMDNVAPPSGDTPAPLSPTKEQKEESPAPVMDIDSTKPRAHKCYLFNMSFGSSKKKIFQIYFDNEYKNVKVLYYDGTKKDGKNHNIVYKSTKSKKIMEQEPSNDKTPTPNEIIPTEIPIESEGWYLLTISFRGHGPSFKNTMVTVKITNTETKKTNKIRFEISRVSFLTDDAIYYFFSNFYGVVTSIIKTQGDFKLKKNKGQDKKFFSNGIVNQKTMDDFQSFLTESKQTELVSILFSPQNYSERDMVIEDIMNGYFFNLYGNQKNQKGSINMINRYGVQLFSKNLKKIHLIGGINSLLPFFDLLFIKNKELLTHSTFELLCKLVADICIKSKYNLLDACLTNFFPAFSLFLQKIPKDYLTPAVYNSFELIANYYQLYYDFLKKNIPDNIDLRVSFLETILLNYKITFNYEAIKQSKINLLNGDKTILPKEDIQTIFNSQTLCVVLRNLDKKRYSEFCCQTHFGMVNNEFNIIPNTSNPQISEKLTSFDRLVSLFLKEDLLKETELSLLIKLLLLDISPCLQLFLVTKIVKVLTNEMGNKVEEVLSKLLKCDFLQIMLFTYMIGLSDVKIQILSLLLWFYREHSQLLDNTKIKIGQNMISGTELMFAYLKENIIPHYLLKRNETKEQKMQRARSIHKSINFFEIAEKEELIIKDLKLPKRKNSTLNKHSKRLEGLEVKKRSVSETKRRITKNKKVTEINDKSTIEKAQAVIIKNPFLFIQNNKQFQDRFRQYIIDFPHKYPERKEEFTQEVIYSKDLEKKINFQEIYRLIFFDNIIKVKSTNPQLTASLIDLLIHFLVSSNNLPVISTFLTDLTQMIFYDLQIEDDPQPLNNEYIYFYQNLHHWVLETSFHLFLLKQNNYKNIKSPFFGDIPLFQLDPTSIDEVEKVLSLFFDLHKKLILLYIKRKITLNQDNNIHYLFDWIVYQKIVLSRYLESKKSATYTTYLDYFIKTLFKNVIEEFTTFPQRLTLLNLSQSSWKNLVVFGNMLSIYGWIINSSDGIISIIEKPIGSNGSVGYLDLEKKPFEPPTYLKIWKNYEENHPNRFKELCLCTNYDILHQFCACFNELLSVDALCSEGSVSTTQKIDNIVSTVVYNKSPNPKFENIIFQLTNSSELYKLITKSVSESKNKIAPFNDENPFAVKTMPLIKILSHFYSSSLANNSTMIITNYEKFLLYIIIVSSTINYKKKIDKNPKLQAINTICYQVIAFGLGFFFQQINSASQTALDAYINSINVLFYTIRKILTHSKVGHISTSPLYKLFKDDIEKKNPLLNPETFKIKIQNLSDYEQCYLTKDKKINDFWTQNLFENLKIQKKIEKFFKQKTIRNFVYDAYFKITNIIPIYSNFELDPNKGKKLTNQISNNTDVAYEVMVSPLFFNNNYPIFYNGFKYKIISKAKEIVDTLGKINRKKKEKFVEKIQIYRRIKKQLFSWRGLWSSKDVFYSQTGKKKFKRKVINHYSLEMANPLLGPVLDVDYYLPKFKYFDTKNLFLSEIEEENGKIEDVNEYNINLNISSILSVFKNPNKIRQNDHGNLYVSDLYLNLYKGELFSVYTSSSSSEKNEIAYKCCIVKPTHHIMGTLYFKEKEMVFVYGDQNNKLNFYNHNKNDLYYDDSNDTCFGSFFILYKRDKDTLKLRIPYNMINFVMKRTYFYRANAIEIFTSNQKSYYLHFIKHEDRKNALNEIEKHFTNKENIRMLGNKADYVFGIMNKDRKFKNRKIFSSFSDMFKKWHEHSVSSFEFLMWCNIFANRSYRDLTQYPVFPWTITDYTSSKLSLEQMKNDTIFSRDITFLRDFAKPMGMLDVGPQSQKRIELIKEEYKNMMYTTAGDDSDEECEEEEKEDNKVLSMLNTINIFSKKSKKVEKIKDNNEIPHFYSTHYSNPMYVSHYLCRLFPFSQLRIELQGEKFDVAERLFSSIQTTFESATSQKTDVRELIPEFYYLPEMFENINNLNIGIKNTNVSLPLWAHNKTYKFVSKLRKVLESDRSQFNFWINLIFGSCQLGEKAIEVCNLFSNSSYFTTFNVENVKDIGLAKYYMRYAEIGLTPAQIFSGDTPLRQALNFNQITTKKEDKNYLQKVGFVKASLNTPIIGNIFSPVTFKFVKESNKRDYYIVFFNENNFKFSIKIDSPSSPQNLAPISPEKQKLSKPFLSGKLNYKTTNPQVLILVEGNIIVQGGFWDGKLIIYYRGKDGQKSKIISNKYDKSPIVYLINDQEENFVVAGTKKGSVIIYDITDKTSINWKILKRLSHHTEEISCLTINDNLQILGTASYDCYVNIYTLIDFKLINSIQVNIIPNVLAFCSSPIPSFVVMQENLYAFAFTINGTPIDITPNMDRGIISSFCTFRDFKAKEYIVLGYSNGTIEIRRLPSLALQDMYDAKNNNSNIPPSKSNMKLAISYDAQFIIAHYNNELFIVTNVDALNHNASSNLGNLGF